MDKYGMTQEILFEDAIATNNDTGISNICPTAFYLWAEEKKENLIKNVKGVFFCETYQTPTHYFIKIDARYDKEFIKKEIEAAILCGNINKVWNAEEIVAGFKTSKELDI
jgi:hypothetical protein